MELISIYFFVLASIFVLETTNIVSEKATVTINSTTHTFEIYQEDLFAIIGTAEDSLILAQELQISSSFARRMRSTAFVTLMDAQSFAPTTHRPRL